MSIYTTEGGKEKRIGGNAGSTMPGKRDPWQSCSSETAISKQQCPVEKKWHSCVEGRVRRTATRQRDREKRVECLSAQIDATPRSTTHGAQAAGTRPFPLFSFSSKPTNSRLRPDQVCLHSASTTQPASQQAKAEHTDHHHIYNRISKLLRHSTARSKRPHPQQISRAVNQSRTATLPSRESIQEAERQGCLAVPARYP